MERPLDGTGAGLRQLAADLWETSADHPAPGLHTHAYLWRSPRGGNVLFYSVASDRDLDEIAALGGVASQHLSHRDEAGPMLEKIAQRFGSRLHAPAVEAAEIGRFRTPDVLFEARGTDAAGVEVVPTPGHSPGSTCFVVDGADGRYLFTGDTLYRSADGPWLAGYLPGISDGAALVESLHVLAAVEPDLVVSSAFAGDAGAHRVDPAEWPRLVGAARRRLEAELHEA